MATLLTLANDVADRLSLDPVSTLYGLDTGNTTGRRLRAAITDACEYLRANFDWQQCRREHMFLTQPREQQTGAIPVDFLRFVEGTMFDRSRRIPLSMAESDRDWAAAKGFPIGGIETKWVRRGNDIWLAPWTQPGLEISFEYHSDAICEVPAVAHDVIHTTDGMTLQPGTRYIVRSGHKLKVATLTAAQSVELVPEGGAWSRLGFTLEMIDGSAIQGFNDPEYGDWISLVRADGIYQLAKAAGFWNEIALPTTNGMTLEATRRYAVGTGHILYIPVLAAGEQIELVPATGTWQTTRAKFVTRDGLDISGPLYDVALITLTADMAFTPAYTMTGAPAEATPYAKSRTASRFTADTDVPLWDDSLVKLGAVWQMKYADGLPYSEDFRAFQMRIYDTIKGSEGHGLVSFRQDAHHDRWNRRPVRHAFPVVIPEYG
jgi:hypothetical protein